MDDFKDKGAEFEFMGGKLLGAGGYFDVGKAGVFAGVDKSEWPIFFHAARVVIVPVGEKAHVGLEIQRVMPVAGIDEQRL